MRYVVYKFTNKITLKSYIGKTNNLKARIRKHLCDDNCVYLSRAIKKYGFENFLVTTLAETDDEQQAYLLEEKFIIQHQTLKPFGYNLLPCDGVHRKLSQESLKKLSKTLQGRNLSGALNRTSEFIGVRKRKKTNLFEMRFRHRGDRYFKYFTTEIEAAEAYDKLAIYFQGIHAKINFVDNMDEYIRSDLKGFFNSICQKKWSRKALTVQEKSNTILP